MVILLSVFGDLPLRLKVQGKVVVGKGVMGCRENVSGWRDE